MKTSGFLKHRHNFCMKLARLVTVESMGEWGSMHLFTGEGFELFETGDGGRDKRGEVSSFS